MSVVNSSSKIVFVVVVLAAVADFVVTRTDEYDFADGIKDGFGLAVSRFGPLVIRFVEIVGQLVIVVCFSLILLRRWHSPLAQ
jgi:mannitol-specific phosphotransferase system IIBC component